MVISALAIAWSMPLEECDLFQAVVMFFRIDRATIAGPIVFYLENHASSA